MQEVWKFYKETNGRGQGHRIYEVSDNGNVRINGIKYTFNEKDRYYRCGSFSIHRAVAELFVSNPDDKPCVDHINGNKHDNRAINLRWVTYSENTNNPSTKAEQFNKLKEAFLNPDYRKKLSQIRKEQMNNPVTRLKCSNNAKGNKINIGRRWVTNGLINKFVKQELVDQYLENGYHLGVTR